MEIKIVYPNPANTQMVVGNLIVKEIKPNVTIDFEQFEVLYLNIKLIDRNQTIGVNTAEGTKTKWYIWNQIESLSLFLLLRNYNNNHWRFKWQCADLARRKFGKSKIC